MYIKVNRSVVQSGIAYAMNLFSKNQSNFNNELDKLGYDKVYHQQKIFSISVGRCQLLEKNERVNASERPKETETMNVPFPSNLTIRQIYNNASKLIGNQRFYSDNASSSNCQDFVMGLLNGSNLANPAIQAFVKQDTKILFANDPKLRKIANSMATIGSKANILMQGGSIKKGNKWLTHVKNFQNKHGCSYRDAMKQATATYKK